MTGVSLLWVEALALKMEASCLGKEATTWSCI